MWGPRKDGLAQAQEDASAAKVQRKMARSRLSATSNEVVKQLTERLGEMGLSKQDEQLIKAAASMLLAWNFHALGEE